jgi:hypothetical protein
MYAYSACLRTAAIPSTMPAHRQIAGSARAIREGTAARLGREVRGRADDALALALLDLRPLAVAKVAHLDERARLRAADERVLELDVAVRDARRMQVFDAADKLLEEVARVVLGEAPRLADQAEELAACTARAGLVMWALLLRCWKKQRVSISGKRLALQSSLPALGRGTAAVLCCDVRLRCGAVRCGCGAEQCAQCCGAAQPQPAHVAVAGLAKLQSGCWADQPEMLNVHHCKQSCARACGRAAMPSFSEFTLARWMIDRSAL